MYVEMESNLHDKLIKYIYGERNYKHAVSKCKKWCSFI